MMNDGDMVLVVHFGGKCWVKENAIWADDWEVQAKAHIEDRDKRFMFDRTRALTLAHNIQNRIHTTFGVWELFLKKQEEQTSDTTDKDDTDDTNEC